MAVFSRSRGSIW